jgi:hypothetical protein
MGCEVFSCRVQNNSNQYFEEVAKIFHLIMSKSIESIAIELVGL